MDFGEIYHFIFETYTGIALSILVCLVICIILAVVMERRTRKKFKDRGPRKDDYEFDDDDDDE